MSSVYRKSQIKFDLTKCDNTIKFQKSLKIINNIIEKEIKIDNVKQLNKIIKQWAFITDLFDNYLDCLINCRHCKNEYIEMICPKNDRDLNFENLYNKYINKVIKIINQSKFKTFEFGLVG